MPKYHIVIADADKAHQFERRRYREAFERAKVRPDRLERLVDERAGSKRDVGVVHAEAVASECPDGLPNCRNCGDPAHVTTCRAAGHCPECGTKHGIAPTSVLVAHGFALEVIP